MAHLTDKPLYRGFTYYTSPTEYTFVPNPEEASRKLKVLTISKKGDIEINEPTSATPTSIGKSIFGIMGIISLATNDYLILITNAELRGKIQNHPIYLATDFQVLPLSTDPNALANSHPIEQRLRDLLNRHLMDGKFWFSYEWDLTRRLQAQVENAPLDKGKALWEMADDRFFWNKHIVSRFIHLTKSDETNDLSGYILPVIYGSFDVRASTIDGHQVEFGLISRRSKLRAGTRYNTRGVDAQGNVGNFNETEQFLSVTSPSPRILSFVQTRGSAPFHWAEIVNLVFVPDLVVMERPDTSAAFALHVNTQQSIYGKQMLVNLVKARGRERHIKDAYEMRVEEYNQSEKRHGELGYEFFDLHTECSKDRWERIDHLVDRLEPYLKENGYFELSEESDTEPTRRQTGVVRSNCMDCLDRTNIVQTYIAKRVLTHQLRDIGFLGANEALDTEAEFMHIFRSLWSDHADYVANAYTGTGALRTDYTRTGVRTKKGVVLDKLTSLVRYILNNHLDGTKQDGFDLFTGAWHPGGPSTARSLVNDGRSLLLRSMKFIWMFAMLMLIAGAILPRQSDYSIGYFLFMWLLVFAGSSTYIVQNGIHYINWPRLVPQPTFDAIYYSGPGARTGRVASKGGIVTARVEGEKLQVTEALKAP